MKKILWLAIIMTLAVLLFSCGNDKNEEYVELDLSRVGDVEYLMENEGKNVEFSGFVIAEGAEDGSFVYLTNIPDQLSPFCKPYSKIISNAVTVKFRNGVTFEAEEGVIKASGVLKVAEGNDYFRDNLGYDSVFYIGDAEYTVEKTDDKESAELVEKIRDEELASELYKMYEYVEFLCFWDRHYVPNKIDENGNKTPGYFLYASDAKNYVIRDNAQWNYGYKEGYFDGIAAKLKEIDETGFETLISNVNKAEQLAANAFEALENGEYTSEYRYVSVFDNYDYVYTITNRETFMEEYTAAFEEFVAFLGSL